MVKWDNQLFRDVVITNDLGLHARSAAQIAQCARKSQSKVWIIKDGNKADAASTLDVLTLVCEKGSTITILIDDPSDLGILDDLVKLVERGFRE